MNLQIAVGALTVASIPQFRGGVSFMSGIAPEQVWATQHHITVFLPRDVGEFYVVRVNDYENIFLTRKPWVNGETIFYYTGECTHEDQKLCADHGYYCRVCQGPTCPMCQTKES